MTGAGRVCVLGVGLIGGSLLRALGPDRAFGWNRSAGPAAAARDSGADVSTDLPGVLARAADEDALVVVGVPMPAVPSVLDAVAAWAPAAPLTDVVSVKTPVLRAVRERGLGARFVGGHPMAGTAESGWAATDPGLFRGARWVVAADDDADPEVFARVAGLAGEVGSVVVAARSVEHDDAVARVSHLPHVLAEALAATGLAGQHPGLAAALGAGSFRDGTRVAGTSPELVRAICEPNATAVLAALDDCVARLSGAREQLAAGGGLGGLVDDGHAARLHFDDGRAVSGGEPVVLTPGEPGWLERARSAGYAGRAVVVAAGPDFVA